MLGKPQLAPLTHLWPKQDNNIWSPSRTATCIYDPVTKLSNGNTTCVLSILNITKYSKGEVTNWFVINTSLIILYLLNQMLWLLFISSHNFLWLLFKSGYHSREAFVEDRRKMKKSSNGGVAADARESRVATTWEQRVIEWIQYFVVVPSLGLPSPHCYWCCWFGSSWEESSEGVLDGSEELTTSCSRPIREEPATPWGQGDTTLEERREMLTNVGGGVTTMGSAM